MKNKTKSESKFFLTFTLSAALISGAIVTHDVAADIHQRHTWANERQVIEITVEPGDTLYSYAEKYAPTWMDLRDYCEAVKDLNGVKTSTLQAFQNYKLYI